MMRTAIRAATLFDGERRIDDPLVVVEDGRVAEVRSGHIQPPSDAELVELPGATLLPGLVDTHVHLAFDGGWDPVATLAERDDDEVMAAMGVAAEAQLQAGVTTVRDLGDRDYLSLRFREEFTGSTPTVVAAGPPITTDGGHCHFLGGVAAGGVRGARAAVREHAERGVDVIKVMASGGMMTEGTLVHEPQFAPAELRAIVDEAHRYGLPVTAHAHAAQAVSDALAAGVDGIEHCTFITEDGVRPVDELIERLVERRVAIGLTVGMRPVEGALPPPLLMRILPDVMALSARLIRAGALVVAGTDAGIAPVKPHGVLPVGLQHLVELGMEPLVALRTGTSVAAGVCGLGDRKGRVAASFDADLLAVDGDPTVDITALHRPVAVFQSGRRVDSGLMADSRARTRQ
ncbi:amidohydrolase family protein [Pseudonocardia sp. TRM90224]|uniref:amidohydrolase family protein n=1 Tax=Pseudonocardia sp. TRM90224 TaxID=2812678 RepID=UPI001E438E01|nr:amidohydrolase family protein [Pseudonocardia sp. TRM90224]